ncbi:MAG: hypothetical protein WCK13_05145 [Ignavibacteriota bacterium]|nr:hypothetical protein [Ignavibacteriota bacterium]
MKNLLFTLLMLAVITSCSKSQDNTHTDWSSCQYFYSKGPLPPPYHYSFEVTINNDGAGALNYHLGYGENTPLNYTFKVSPEDLKLLGKKICHSKIASGNVDEVSESNHPVGGPTEYARIIITNSNPDLDQPPRVFQSPVFPKEEFKSDLKELYEFVRSLVPGEVWLDAEGKKTEYETNFKK